MKTNGSASTEDEQSPGQVIRALRLRKGLTLAEVSERTGMAISSLSRLEKGLTSLSYDKLMLLSDGLGVDMASLLEPRPEVPRTTSSAGGRRVFQRAGEGQLIETQGYKQLYLSTELLSKQMTPMMVEIRARSLSEFIAEFGGLIRHAGEEFTLVLEGELDFHTELYAPLRLKAGDSLYFDSEMGHAYINATDARCHVVCVSTAHDRQAKVADLIAGASGGHPGERQAASAGTTRATTRSRAPARRKAER